MYINFKYRQNCTILYREAGIVVNIKNMEIIIKIRIMASSREREVILV